MCVSIYTQQQRHNTNINIIDQPTPGSGQALDFPPGSLSTFTNPFDYVPPSFGKKRVNISPAQNRKGGKVLRWLK